MRVDNIPMTAMKGKVGVVLSGCGHLDGAEIREAVLALLALDRHDLEAVCMAPSGPQRHVVDHLTGQEMAGEVRDVRREAARIARGDVVELAEVSVDDIDALVYDARLAGVADGIEQLVAAVAEMIGGRS